MFINIRLKHKLSPGTSYKHVPLNVLLLKISFKLKLTNCSVTCFKTMFKYKFATNTSGAQLNWQTIKVKSRLITSSNICLLNLAVEILWVIAELVSQPSRNTICYFKPLVSYDIHELDKFIRLDILVPWVTPLVMRPCLYSYTCSVVH